VLVEVRVPVLAESVAEATLMDWHKQPGDPVKFGDALIDVETDKVTLEVVAPEDGMLVKILKNSGEDVVSDELIAEIDTDGQAVTATPEPEPDTESAPIEPGPAQEPEDTPQGAAKPVQTETEPAGDVQQPTQAEQKPKLSPAVRNLLGEHGLDAGDIPTSGDRLTKKDVLAYLETVRADEPDAKDSEQAGADKAPATEATAPKPAHDGDSGRTPPAEDKAMENRAQLPGGTRKAEDAPGPESAGKRVPMTRLRRRAAERLLAAQRENAILTTFNEVNMKPVMDLRNRYKDNFEKIHKVKLGFMSFFTKAAVEALKKFPIINASVDGADIIYHDNFDIGIAVSSPRGLVVPVVRAADMLSFAEIEKTISEYGQKAHDAKLTIEDLTGGTFTITNGGVFGSLLSTPIINPPQSAILGMHKIEERPVAEDGAVVIRPMMYLALSYDHRIVDGREAVSFLVAIKEALEDPSRLLLQI
jgi:2-oxoglutarate dehydrogenase E2 component (dihydrolipoamide succinyltransferase)